LLGKSFDNKLKWVAGLYYFREKGENINPIRFSIVEAQSGGYFESSSIAGFAQATYTLADTFDFTVGMRYTHETRDYLPDQYITRDPLGFGGVGARIVPYIKVSTDYNKLVPLVSLAYRPSKDAMIYATYTEGFRSGGFTQRIFPPEASLPSFDPEKVKSYEAGAKLTAFDRRLRVNLAGYFTRYTDMQLLASDPSRVGPFVTNAGDADIWGFEVESSFIPAEGWLIEGNLGYVDPKRTSVSGGVVGLTTDSRFEHISRWTANVQITKHIPLAKSGALTPRAEWSYRSGYGTSAANVPRQILPPAATGGVPQPALYQKGFSLFSASLRWDVADTGASLTLGVDNLTNKRYRTMGDYAASFGYSQEVFDRGRQWYGTLAYKF
jgi:iron complex outermembrane receptor protein